MEGSLVVDRLVPMLMMIDSIGNHIMLMFKPMEGYIFLLKVRSIPDDIIGIYLIWFNVV